MEDIDIKKWAQQVRTIKIYELRELIESTEKEYQNDYESDAITKCHKRARITELQKKLKILQNV